MASFSYRYPSSEFDSFLVPYAASNNISSLPEQGSIITTQTCFNPSPTLLASIEYFLEIPLHSQIHETIPLDKSCTLHVPFPGNPSLTRKQEPKSSPMLANEIAILDQVTQTLTSTEKKRKNVDIKVEREDKDERGKERRIKSCSKKRKKAPVEPPSGYVYVRARRGEATDSHSLAERVRRAKISEKMKLLQSLVPGCEKMAGKPLILEQIIQYVQTLQAQVEFLAAKLASVTPMYNDFELDFDTSPPPKEGKRYFSNVTVSYNRNDFDAEIHKIFDNGNLLWVTDEDGRKQELPYNQYGFDNFLFNI